MRPTEVTTNFNAGSLVNATKVVLKYDTVSKDSKSERQYTRKTIHYKEDVANFSLQQKTMSIAIDLLKRSTIIICI